MTGTLLVTGGGRGIGASIALLAAARGYAVGVNYRSNAARAEQVVARIREAGGRALALPGDTASEVDMARVFDSLQSAFGRLTALVNNAGVTGGASRVDALSAADLRAVLDINVVGCFICAREAVKRMSTRYGGGGGAIVNVSSRAAERGGAGEWVHYAASKGAIDTLTRGLAGEVAEEGIRVNAVKHGALSNAHGSIVVECRAEPSAGQFVVSWREVGGPPVIPPNRKGFGSVIIERSLQHEIRGTTAVTFSPEGISCRIGIPMQYIRAPAAGAP